MISQSNYYITLSKCDVEIYQMGSQRKYELGS